MRVRTAVVSTGCIGMTGVPVGGRASVTRMTCVATVGTVTKMAAVTRVPYTVTMRTVARVPVTSEAAHCHDAESDGAEQQACGVEVHSVRP